MKGKTVLITGGNAGIGKQTAIGLARKGARVIIVTRDAGKGVQATEEIKSVSGSLTVEFMVADLSSFNSVKTLAKNFQNNNQSLDILINNAGAFYTDFQKTIDGYERQWQINHLSGFLLTNLLLESLKAADSARIINVSSKGHYRGFIYFKDLNREKKYNGLAAYAQSKLANVMFGISLSEKLRDTNVTAFSLHPGVVKTSIGDKNNTSWIASLWSIGKMFMISEAEGAKTSIFLASDANVVNNNGGYFDKCRPKEPNPQALDASKREKLWRVSSEQTGINF